MIPLVVACALLASSPELAEGVARAVAVEAAQDARFEVVSELDVAATAGFAADQQTVGAGGPSATGELAAAYNARFVLTVNLYAVAEETHVALAVRDVEAGTIVARGDVGAVETKQLLVSVREQTRTLLARLTPADGARPLLFISGGRVEIAKSFLVGKARRPTRVEPRSGIRMVLVPAGDFELGCVDGDAACTPGEKPAVKTSVAGFWMGQTEVTVAAWERCVRAGRCVRTEPAPKALPPERSVQSAADGLDASTTKLWLVIDLQESARPASGAAFNHGVHDVSSSQADAFCAFMGGRLPTAVEWEYAAKAGRPNVYPWGREEPTRQHVVVPATDWLGFPLPPVQHFAGAHRWGANRWGLLDMAGSLYEWTATKSQQGLQQVRGGAYTSTAPQLRTSSFLWIDPAVIAVDLGFRCVVPVDDAKPAAAEAP